MKEEILRLRSLGYTYNQIVSELGCSKGTVSYHCGSEQKQKSFNRSKANKRNHSIGNKIHGFRKRLRSDPYYNNNSPFRVNIRSKIVRFTKLETQMEMTINYIINRINKNPHCELTGLPINIEDTKSWHLDHKLPTSRGGDNSIENLQILSARANQAKHNMTNEEFIELCKLVLEYNGYSVNQSG